MPNPGESNENEQKTDQTFTGVRFHTDSFSNEEFLNAYDETEKGSNKLPIISLLDYLDHHDYGKMENFLLIHIDALDGIKSSIVADEKRFPTGIGFVRDATNALPLANRLPANHPHLLKDNMLLRVLGTLRGIDHVLNHKLHATDTLEDDKKIYSDAIHNLNVNYNKLLVDVTIAERPDLQQLQDNFYIDLIDILHQTKLDTGITKVKDFSLLLGHYRDMAALIDPAKSLVSISVDNNSLPDGSIIHTETCHPITEKNAVQKQQLSVMETLQLNVPKAEQNFHSAKKRAFQEVNVAFAKDAVSDDRRFAPQSRKFIGPGLKNAYQVHYEIDYQKNGESIGKSAMTSLRTGSMTYIGNDDTQEHNEQYTYENLVQMKKAGDDKPLHTTMLLTNTSKGREDYIIATTKSASAKLENKFSLFH